MTYLDLGFNAFLENTIVTGETKLSPGQSRNMIAVGSVDGSKIIPPINATTDIVFSSTDNDTAAWTEGTLYFTNGTATSLIAAGNTGNISATTYVYFDMNKTGVLHTSTVISDASGATKLMVAIIETGDTGKDCKITPFVGAGLNITNIVAEQIKTGTLTTGLLTVGAQSYVSTVAWTATDYNTATWAAGTIRTADGTSYSIASGNTGNITATTYVYLEPTTSTTVLQTTSTATSAVGDGKLLVAIVTMGASGSKCVIDPIFSTGTTISGNSVTTGKVQSADGKTYFDLDNDQIGMSDGSNELVFMGNDA